VVRKRKVAVNVDTPALFTAVNKLRKVSLFTAVLYEGEDE
jgi:hypothetical protein